ncbi:probable transporter Seo1p [Trichomonascus vanleenenianus]|uniref:putative permease SEO1 n=1 Tax=Trichomonascus vanleenenianus TaxID=2268995 RepID=UPI003ECA2262
MPGSILKWFPHLRDVKDIEESESDSDAHAVEVQSVTYEYRDEAKRPWWKFFNEYEYRLTTDEKRNHKWWKWFEDADSPAERRLLFKLDILLAFYSFIVYWVKYLDQTNLNNAYVTGMKEDLGMKGNDLVITQAVYTVGSVIFQLPFMYLFSKAPINFLLPIMDIGWGLFTLGIYRANNVSQLQALRFFVGVFESSFYPAVHYMFGCWYKPSEYGRRGGIYYLGQMLGLLTAGLLQAATYDNLNGTNGLAGWRWMFIIDAIITFPVALIGIWSLPGTPDKCYSVFLTDDEIRLARKRMQNKKGEAPTPKFPKFLDVKLWKSILGDWKIYILTLFNVFCWNNNNGSSGAYLLWLKSLDRFAPGKLNQIAAITPALGMLWILIICTGADVFQSRWGAIVVSQVFNFIGNVILAVWDVPERAKWFAFMLQYFGWSMASVLYGWMADICRHDPQERAIVLVVMNILAQTSTAWISVLVWKTVEAPRYLKGFSFTATSAFCLAAWTFVVLWFYKRDERKHARDNGIILYDSSKGEVPEVAPEDHTPVDKAASLEKEEGIKTTVAV